MSFWWSRSSVGADSKQNRATYAIDGLGIVVEIGVAIAVGVVCWLIRAFASNS